MVEIKKKMNLEDINIFEAIQDGDLNLVKEYLERGGDIDRTNGVFLLISVKLYFITLFFFSMVFLH